ncbi:hypothetical protein LPN04_31040 [Rugamonas sp. A1-17]|nr:hypothetical protein [Rugamonas sp. A1-17]
MVPAPTEQVIMALADAFHNIPDYVAMPAAQRKANAFMLTTGIKQAQQVNKRHGLNSNHLAPL